MAPNTFLNFTLLFLLKFTPLLVAASEQCWFPDGRTTSTDIPCNTDGSASACCSRDAFCLDNGLCMSGGLVSRGSCTDKSWSDPACAPYCRDCNNSGGCPFQPCDDAENTWTCGTSNSNCVNDEDVFTMIGGNAIVLRATQVAALQSGTEHVLTIDPTTKLEVESGAGGGDDDNGGGASRDGSSTSSGNGLYTAGDMAGVGAGVGVPLLLALFGALFVIMRQRKRLQRATSAGQMDEHKGYVSAAAYAPMSAQSPGYGSYPPSGKPSSYSPNSYNQSAYPNARPGHFRELDPVAQVNELDNATQRQELPAGK